MYADDFLEKKLNERKEQNAFRSLKLNDGKIDFCSNDYLGIAKQLSIVNGEWSMGSTGSRLLAGNYPLIEETENIIAQFHQSDAALIFNSGYDANLGLLSSVPQKNDLIMYDALAHASIRDGIRLSFAQSFAFVHHDLIDLEKKLQHAPVTAGRNIFVVTESVFSMDGDICPLKELIAVCKKYNAHLIIDEAHATGIIGERGEGLVQQLQLQDNIFARVHTFGKAIGCHGAAVLGSRNLRDHLINFARSLMYSTALPPHAVAAIKESYNLFPLMQEERKQLNELVQIFQSANLKYEKLVSATAIQGVIVPGNTAVRQLAETLQQQGFDVRAVLYPTVPKGKERLRIVLHAFNTKQELERLMQLLK